MGAEDRGQMTGDRTQTSEDKARKLVIRELIAVGYLCCLQFSPNNKSKINI